MPDGVTANYISSSDVFDFPVGTILIKNFSYENILPELSKKNIETRLMIKKETGWIFADYIWNEEQTEASFSLAILSWNAHISLSQTPVKAPG